MTKTAVPTALAPVNTKRSHRKLTCVYNDQICSIEGQSAEPAANEAPASAPTWLTLIPFAVSEQAIADRKVVQTPADIDRRGIDRCQLYREIVATFDILHDHVDHPAPDRGAEQREVIALDAVDIADKAQRSRFAGDGGDAAANRAAIREPDRDSISAA